MYKKIITVSIVTICILVLIIPSSVLSQESKEINGLNTGIFSLQSNLRISWDANDTVEPITPKDEIKEINLNIEYGITRGLLGRFLLMLYSSRQATITLEIVDTPSWATATLAKETLTTAISDETKTTTTVLSIHVSEDAPAFGNGYVKIKAKTESLNGPLGRLTIINGTTTTVTVNFQPDYLAEISIEKPFDFKKISPVNTTTIPINITNLGNGETTIDVEIEELPENWTISIDQDKTIPVGDTKKIELEVLPYKKFKNETIKIKFTPTYSKNTNLEGESTSLEITLGNDGSLKEKDDELLNIDTTLLVLLIVIVILIIIVLIFLIRRKIK